MTLWMILVDRSPTESNPLHVRPLSVHADYAEAEETLGRIRESLRRAHSKLDAHLWKMEPA